MLSILKNSVFYYVRVWLRFFSTDYTAHLPEGPALIIAPHPDDETIGCGATIARFCAEGRKVHVIVATDGNASTQSAVITPEELSVIRRNETLKAMKILGLSEENVFFLSYPDNKTTDNIQQISEAIGARIAQLNPAIIFTPHPFDEHEDHRAMASVVGQLQDEGKVKALVLQYPVWYKTIGWPYGILRCLLSVPMYHRYRYVSADHFLAQKDEALMEYRSQFENLTGEKSWQCFSAASRKRFCNSPELFCERLKSQVLPASSDIKAASGNFDIVLSHDVHSIQNDWEQLEKEGVLTPFQRKVWLLPLYAILVPQLNAKPVFVLIRDKVSGRPLMLLPLCARRRFGISIIEFADLGVSDYNAPLISRAFSPSPSEWQELWRHVKTVLGKSSILWLKKMPHLIGDRPNPLVQYSKKPKLMVNSSWGFALPATPAEYTKQMLPPSFAKELAKKFRRVAKRGATEYAIAGTRDEKRAVFDVLARQRQVRCDEMGRINIMAQPVYRQFYESVAMESPEALISLGMLKVGGEIVGTVFTLNHQKSTHVIISTYEGGEWRSCSLGNVVMQSAIDHSINNGANFFDLTIGNESYKQDFGAKPSSLYFTLQPLTPLSSPVVLMMTCGAYTKKAVKYWMLSLERKFGKNFRVRPSATQTPVLPAG